MVWIGIGLIIIGIALLGLVGIMIKPMMKAASVLSDVKKTTSTLPETVGGMTEQVNEALHTGVDMLQLINTQLKELTPIFYLVGDVGRATKQLSSNMVDAVEDFERKETFATRKNLEALYGALTLGILLFQKAKDFANENNIVDNQ